MSPYKTWLQEGPDPDTQNDEHSNYGREKDTDRNYRHDELDKQPHVQKFTPKRTWLGMWRPGYVPALPFVGDGMSGAIPDGEQELREG